KPSAFLVECIGLLDWTDRVEAVRETKAATSSIVVKERDALARSRRGDHGVRISVFAICDLCSVGCVACGCITVARWVAPQRVSAGICTQVVTSGWDDRAVRYRAARNAIRSRYGIAGTRTGSDGMIGTAIVVDLNVFVGDPVRALKAKLTDDQRSSGRRGRKTKPVRLLSIAVPITAPQTIPGGRRCSGRRRLWRLGRRVRAHERSSANPRRQHRWSDNYWHASHHRSHEDHWCASRHTTLSL